jgi:hypothetical protein
MPSLNDMNSWVLLRKGKPQTRHASGAAGKKFYNSLRWQGRERQPDASLLGPGGEAWYCGGAKDSVWHRDDARRARAYAARRQAIEDALDRETTLEGTEQC